VVQDQGRESNHFPSRKVIWLFQAN